MTATISSDVLASYAADAAREVDGVRGLVESTLHRHKGVRVVTADSGVRIELHVAVEVKGLVEMDLHLAEMKRTSPGNSFSMTSGVSLAFAST